MLDVGSLVDGKYRVLDRIGTGGMSVVWEARNDRSNKMWAIKEVLRQGLIQDRVAEMGLLAEIDTLKGLRHEHIVAISDVIETDESLLILMDYVEGNPLGEPRTEDLQGNDECPLIDGAFAQEDVIRWATQLADVFSYLHAQEPPIVYRDLKPSNIMLKPNGDLVLIDFGTARRWTGGQLESVTGAPQGTVALGTLGYAAPEVVMGNVTVDRADPRADIYSLGVTLFHLVTGRNPSHPPYGLSPIRQFNPTLSGGLEKIIAKCTQPDPDQRYQTCAELLYDLKHLHEVDDDFRAGLRHKIMAFAVPCLVSVLLVGAGLVSLGMGSDARQADFEQVMADALAQADGSGQQVALLEQAMALQPTNGQPYVEFLKRSRDDADEFSEADNAAWKKIMTDHRAELSRSGDWPQVEYQAGLTYAFFYTGSEGERIRKAAQAFEAVVASGRSDLPFFHDADLYKQVFQYRKMLLGKIHDDVDPAQYWAALQEMVDSVDKA
ncbi:MAG: serine/threonine protein kinase, partial [Propionibacteriaceae bacterium]|nr:serine/threonine protein kinase [Propionibacteriaceae bacterium]